LRGQSATLPSNLRAFIFQGGAEWPFARDLASASAALRCGGLEIGQREAAVWAQNRYPGSLGCEKEVVEASWGARWRTGGQAQMRENLDDHRGIFDRREDG